MRKPKLRRGEKGVTLFIGTLSLLFIIPMTGMVIDVGFLYAVKAKLQASVDGAALGAARALNIGQTTAAQALTAQAHAVNWFYSNFPPGFFGTKNTVMSVNNVQVFDDANNAHLRNVTVTATTQVDSFFMKWLGFDATTIASSGNASRRDVVAMLVLDRSGSMGVSCPDMVNAAKLFTGQFAAGRDYIGAVSFSDNVYLHSSPSTNFQTILGYTNDSGNANGDLDKITCKGGTGTAGAMSVAYNELYKQNLPGALNLMLIETDGLPNTLILNWWDNAANSAGLANASTCTDKNGQKMSQGGFGSSSVVPNWTAGHPLGSGSYFADTPAGMVGAFFGADPSQNGGHFFMFMMQYWTNTVSNNFNSTSYVGGTNCNFDGNHSVYPPPGPADLAWFPVQDVFGNQLSPATNPYKSPVTLTGGHVVANNWTDYHNSALNATDNAAYRARTNMGLAAGAGIGPVYVFTIGLGGNSGDPPDAILLQRLANDPNPDNFNTPVKYQPCALEAGCITYPSQPQGTFIYSADRTKLSQAFLSISSQILRLSK